jgi:hypothetical protein
MAGDSGLRLMTVREFIRELCVAAGGRREFEIFQRSEVRVSAADSVRVRHKQA